MRGVTKPIALQRQALELVAKLLDEFGIEFNPAEEMEAEGPEMPEEGEEPGGPEEEAAEARILESHKAEVVGNACPLCGQRGAYRYPGHSGLLVCQHCGKTYDPSIE